MYDRYNRKVNYLRISVTDRCNLRCVYCMPERGIIRIKHQNILSYEEIISFTKIAAASGIDKVRVTGGEPLIRKNIVYFFKLLAKVDGIKDISLTTNGILLAEYAKRLKNVGLQRVNISLDTLDPAKYKSITRGGDISKVMQGIEAAEKANLFPIKINCVVNTSSAEPDAVRVKAFCESRNLRVRFIHRMNLETGEYAVVEGGTGGNCILCNKLRLTSDGNLRPCLFSDLSFNIRKLGAVKAINMAIEAKPEYGTRSLENTFSAVGG